LSAGRPLQTADQIVSLPEAERELTWSTAEPQDQKRGIVARYEHRARASHSACGKVKPATFPAGFGV
jgi:hypothetical protein